jgi:hypothetical protein
MGSMEAYIHRENLIILKRRLADPNITDERRQMLTRLLALVRLRLRPTRHVVSQKLDTFAPTPVSQAKLEQARGGPEKDDALGAPIHNAQRHSGGHT